MKKLHTIKLSHSKNYKKVLTFMFFSSIGVLAMTGYDYLFSVRLIAQILGLSTSIMLFFAFFYWTKCLLELKNVMSYEKTNNSKNFFKETPLDKEIFLFYKTKEEKETEETL